VKGFSLWPRSLWPRSLAGRLVLLLVGALAAAQLVLMVMLRSQQDFIVREMTHGMALNQMVTLSRLLMNYPKDEGDKLVRTFTSKQTCARVITQPVVERQMTMTEERLAATLHRMFHNIKIEKPFVSIDPIGDHEHPCEDIASVLSGSVEAARPFDFYFMGGSSRVAAVSVVISLPDERQVLMRTALNSPPEWNRAPFLSFLFSSLAVAGVVIFFIRSQTRSLRQLADASERFGRGETVAPLETSGPSEVVVLIQAFNTMQGRLSDFIKDRLRLLAGVSHDLRTPLTTLRLKAEFVDDDGVRDGIIATVDEMTAICETTLAFTRAEATTEQTEVVDLGTLVGEIQEDFDLVGEDVHLKTSTPVTYPCRPVALKRALRNLIENAIRYGGKAEVSFAREADAVTIRVEDNGEGLPQDMIEEAFKPFVRLEPSRNAETGGIGLGLAIARSIVKAHGGTLTLANMPEGGLRAEICLPVQ